MYNLCYLAICMTLQQCRQYRDTLVPVLPGISNVDVFYWLNPDGLEPASNEFSLTQLIESTDELKQWSLMSTEAGNWLPWYHYLDSTTCDAIVRLDNGFVLRDNIQDYPTFFRMLSAISAAKGDVLVNLESSCSSFDQLGIDSANILVDITTMQQLLSNFQQQCIDEAMKFYLPGAFAKFLAPYAITETYILKPEDLTFCSGVETVTEITSTVPAEQNFIRLSRPLNLLGDDVQVNAVVKAGCPGRELVF